jgi:hypothetical protein
MRSTLVLFALVAVTAPLSGQAAQAAKDKDPTITVQGSAQLPSGWKLRFDTPGPGRAAPKAEDVKFVTMGQGYHFTSGPAAIYYNPKDVMTGTYTVTASLTQTKAPTHPEAYGIFVGGHGLQDSTQQYIYFLTRGDGKILINHRAGADVHKIVDWTASDATKPQDAAGKSTNELSIDVKADSVLFLANGKVVKGFAKSEMHGFNTDGQAGLRVNHNLDVHVGSFQAKAAAQK